MWLYYEATHGPLTYCNPISEAGVRDLEAVLSLEPGARVLDIACGHGAILLGMAERHGVSGVGVDASPYAFPRAQARLRATPGVDVDFVHGRGEDFAPEDGERFDVSMCIGASWIWDGWEGTLDALVGFTKPGGLVVAGEPFWRAEPPAPYLASQELTAEGFPTLDTYAEGVWARGHGLVWMRGASVQEWDAYEMLQAWAFDRWARENPDHPDLEEIRARHVKDKLAYLRWGRDCVGFAVWVIRTAMG